MGEVARYVDSFRLCYVRGPEGIIVELAEQITLTVRRGRPATNQSDPTRVLHADLLAGGR